ncbi:MAG: UPF0182 family protein [Chloroflexia bacterium]|nr:UPF0182 family protein [Chloroflexia bacterium]
MIITAAIIAVLIITLFTTANFWINWWWFGSVGYRSALVTRYIASAIAFLLGGVIAAWFFWANWSYALRDRSRPRDPRLGTHRPTALRRIGAVPLWMVTGLVFLIAGIAAADRWRIWLLFLRGGEFGLQDPIFDRDAGFYIFTVPALVALQRGAITVMLVTVAVVAVVYVIRLGGRGFNVRQLPQRVRTHILALGGGLLLLLGFGYILANYRLLSSSEGVVYGLGYTEANVVRWTNYALAAISIATAALLLLNAVVRRLRWLLIALGAWAITAVVLGGLVPSIVQQTIVEPNELSRERPFIAYNIAMTRAAFDLEGAEVRTLSGEGEPTPAELSPESPTFDNIRLWDYRVIRQTFQQLRSFVPYYVFPDVDVDRYQIDGRMQQVLISARELDPDGLTSSAQTWVNRHLVYTHGYGAVVSPISEATNQGLPRFLVGGIPPDGTGALAIERPEIYFGEQPSSWVAVNTRQQEVSGIQGETESGPYTGTARGSIGLGSYPRRLLLAISQRDRRILFSNELSGDSQVLLRRGIVERAEAIAPFLTYDDDPYLVIADGRLVWVIDAYTTTSQFPYATPVDGVNYLRHSAKVTIDAYDGTITFYRTGTPDPIADAYDAIFGDLFRPISEAPPTVAAHFRYPEGLFDIQAETYASYHVTDPSAFYNGEDRWEIAEEEIERNEGRNTVTEQMEAYYVSLPLPGEPDAGFGLVLPFTPNNRQNMTAWMAGQTNAESVPRLVVYRFPRQANIFGPQQVEAQISVQPEISSQTSLLDQRGSRVIRGNLLVIPIGDTVLYAQPLYLEATATAGSPTELAYVILVTNEQVVMRPTLLEALTALTEGSGAATIASANAEVGTDAPPSVVTDQDGLATEALATYERAQEALARGDWTRYGAEQEALEAILRQLAREIGTPAAEVPADSDDEPAIETQPAEETPAA